MFVFYLFFFFFFKQKTAYEMRISDWSSDVCSSDLNVPFEDDALWLLGRAADGSMRDAMSLTDQAIAFVEGKVLAADVRAMLGKIGRASCRERVCQYV